MFITIITEEALYMHMLHVRAGLHAHDHRRYVLQLVNAAFRHLCAVIRTYSCLPLLSSLSRGKSRAAERRAGVSASLSGLRSEVKGWCGWAQS